MKMKFLNAFLILAGLFIFLVVVETQLSFSDASRHCENNVRKFIKDIDEAYKTQNIEALEKLAYLARACYKDGELQSEIKTKIKIFRDNNKTTFPNQDTNTKDNISIFPKSEQDKISVGGISTNNPFNQPYIGGVQGQEQNFKDNVIYATDYTNKPNKKVGLAEIGDKVRTPDTNPDDFTKKGANYINKNTGEIWQKSHTNHSGDSIGEWKVGINGRPPTKNNKITIRRSNNEIIKVTQ